MPPKKSILLACLGVLGSVVFVPRPAACAQAGGVTAEWDVRKDLNALSAHVKRLTPMLDQIKPEDWISQGAPDVYVTQLKSTRGQAQSLVYSTQKLAEDPARLTAALDAFFRIETLGMMLRSLGAGVRKYQNPALADLLESTVAEGAAQREKLRQYVIDLAADREQEFKVIDQEAQRCRATLSRQPSRKSGARKEEHQ